MKGCVRCDGLKVVDPGLLADLKRENAKLAAEIVKFCQERKIDHRELEVLPQIATIIRVVEGL